MRARRQRGIVLTGYVVLAIGLALAGAGAALWYLDRKLEGAQEQLRSAREALGREEESRKGFQAAALACGKSVSKIAERAAAAEAQHAAGKAEAQAREKALSGYVSDLLTRPAAKDECAGMRQELNDEIDRRSATRK